MLNLANEIKDKYSTKQIKELMKYLKAPTTKKVKDDYLANLELLFKVVKPNKIRPCIGSVSVTDTYIIGSDLYTTIFIPNNYNVPTGNYTKEQMKAKCYNSNEQYVEDYPKMRFLNSNIHTKVNINSNILKQAINSTIFAIASDEQLSLNGIRFIFSKGLLEVHATNTFMLISKKFEVESNEVIEFTLPETICKVLLAIDADDIDVEILVGNDNKIQFGFGDERTIVGRVIDLSFPDVKNYKFYTTNTIEVNVEELTTKLNNLKDIAKSAQFKNCIEFNFEDSNKIALIAKSEGITIKETINNTHGLDFANIGLNIRFILDYLDTINDKTISIRLSNSKDAVIINNEFIVMPVKLD